MPPGGVWPDELGRARDSAPGGGSLSPTLQVEFTRKQTKLPPYTSASPGFISVKFY